MRRWLGLTFCWLDIHKPPRRELADKVVWSGPCERCGTMIAREQLDALRSATASGTEHE